MRPLFRSIKNGMKALSGTPLHPQWLSRIGRRNLHRMIGEIPDGSTVLDVGCYDKWPERYLASGCMYIGADYPETALEWYGSKPHIFCDAAVLPFKTQSVDTVLLLDVLEHLEDADIALAEIHRVLRAGGLVIMQVPFMYPLHDEPRDFRRITSHGYAKLARRHGFEVVESLAVGQPMETAGLLVNIALAKQLINWLLVKSPLILLGVVIPFVILLVNLSAMLMSRLGMSDHMMPFSYQVVLRKD